MLWLKLLWHTLHACLVRGCLDVLERSARAGISRAVTRLGVTSAEIQTAVRFAMTIIGVVIFSGRFFSWPRVEQIVATLVLVGLGWLLVRTGE